MSRDDAWQELGATMRRLRQASGQSLRYVEATGDWARGTLSQVETAKARPSAALVEFYDSRFGGDGLLLSMFADAHATRVAVRPLTRGRVNRWCDGDVMDLLDSSPASGAATAAGAMFEARWLLRNAGAVPWQGRSLRRVGATAGVRLIASAASVPLADTAPGEVVEARCPLIAPEERGTVVAHWAMARRDGSYCFPSMELLSLTVVVT